MRASNIRHVLVSAGLILFAYAMIVIVGHLLRPPYVGKWRLSDRSLWFLGRDFDESVYPVNICTVSFSQGPESGTGSVDVELTGPINVPVRNKTGEIQVPVEQTTWHVPFKWARVPMRNVPPSIRIEIQDSSANPRLIAGLLPEQQVFEWQIDSLDRLVLCRAGHCHVFTKARP